MRATRLTVLVFAVPIAAFIGLLVLVTVLWIHPPTIGWIGLAVVALVSIAIGVAGYVLFPRMSVNADPVAAPERARLLVLADASAPVAELCDTVVLQLAGRDAKLLVVAPVLPPPSRYVANDEGAARSAAEERLAGIVAGLRGAGLAVSGRVGTDDPVQALGDALAEFPAAEVLIVTAGEAVWLERGLFERARAFAPVVEHVEAGAPAAV